MRNVMKLAAFSFLLLTSNVFSQEAATPAAVAEAPIANEATTTSNQNEEATIIFFRQKKFAGGGVRFKVREGEKVLGKMKSGTYFVHKTTSGEHEFTVHSEAKDVLTIKAEAGKTYYVEGEIEMGILVGRPTINVSNELAFEGKKKSMKEFVFTDGSDDNKDDDGSTEKK